MATDLHPSNKPTRFRGPVAITLRGAGSGGNDPLKVGDGTDVGLTINVPANTVVNGETWGQTGNCLQVCKPDGTVIFQVDANANVAQSGVLNAVQCVAQITLSAAQISAMYGAPVVLIAAPAAGIGIVVDQVLFEMKATATAFTGGGVVTAQYGTTAHGAGNSVHAGSIPASVVNAGSAGNTLTLLGPASAANGTTVPNDGTSASGVYISNATAAFATGTGTAVVTIFYSLVTLQ